MELTCPNGNCAVNCLFSVTPTTLNVTGVAGTSVVNVVASSSGCQWTASSNSSFLNVAPANGTGSGTAIISYSDDVGDDRVGTVTIAGKPITVTQLSSKLDSMTITLKGNTAFNVSSPEFPSLVNTCTYVPNPFTGQFTTCIQFGPHGTYHYIASVPLAVATGCDLLSPDRRTCTVNLTSAPHPGIFLQGS